MIFQSFSKTNRSNFAVNLQAACLGPSRPCSGTLIKKLDIIRTYSFAIPLIASSSSPSLFNIHRCYCLTKLESMIWWNRWGEVSRKTFWYCRCHSGQTGGKNGGRFAYKLNRYRGISVPTFRSCFRHIAISKLRLNFSRVKRKLGTRVLMKRLVRT